MAEWAMLSARCVLGNHVSTHSDSWQFLSCSIGPECDHRNSDSPVPAKRGCDNWQEAALALCAAHLAYGSSQVECFSDGPSVIDC